MKFNWDQKGMPVSLVSRLGRSNEFSEFKSVLNDAQNQVLQHVDAEAMARELVQSGGREYVEMVRELTAALANTRKELEEANRRYERLTADLRRRGVPLEESKAALTDEKGAAPVATVTAAETSAVDQDEWEEWNRRFESLLR